MPSLASLEAEILRRQRNRLDRYYPETGALRRELYPKHCAFFAGGAQRRERLMLAANRVGKTEGVGAYETTLHLTGKYPDWWVGRRFTHPIKGWAAGDTNRTVRDIIQGKLLGPPGKHGTGLIPGDLIARVTSKPGTPDAVEAIYVKHVSGGVSVLGLKSYMEGREAFQGTEQDLIWLDEEPPLAVYTECLLRTMTTDGLVLLTFTPLSGLSEVVLTFLPGGAAEELSAAGKFVVFCTWDEVPHLSDQVKKELYASIPPHQREARSKGVPSLGSGAIYPVPETDIVVQDFAIPDHWPRAYGLDVGWNRTAAVWGAINPDERMIYLYSEHYRGQAEPSIHAHAVKARGDWIQGVIDPAARGRSQRDGQQLLQDYVDLGLDLEKAINAVEAGFYEVWQLLSGGHLKVFASLSNWREEFRLYRRDDAGKVVKEKDHLMDATRYLIVSGRDRMSTKPAPQSNEYNRPSRPRGWKS